MIYGWLHIKQEHQRPSWHLPPPQPPTNPFPICATQKASAVVRRGGEGAVGALERTRHLPNKWRFGRGPDRFTQLPQTKRRRGSRQQRRGLQDFCADCKPVCHFCWISHLLFFLTPPRGNKVSFVSSRLQPPPSRPFLYCSYMLNRSEDATFCRFIHDR